MPDLIGRTLGHYRIVEQIGEGGMGVVYRARDERLQRDVALKVLPGAPADRDSRARLLREARSASALNHHHICTIHDVGHVEGVDFIVMEYVAGRPLNELISAPGLPSDAVARYGGQIADALVHAHARGVVHRDLKTANVVVTNEGRVKVLDFGLALRSAAAEPAAGTTSAWSSSGGEVIAGTPLYMAPEVLRGERADARSDIWGLGVILFEMATGQRPFQGSTQLEVIGAILHQPHLPLPAQVPAPLRAAIQRCLEKEPGRRFQRATQVRDALQAAATAPAPRPRRLRARPALVWGAVALVVGLVGLWAGLAWVVSPGSITSLVVLPFDNVSGDPQQEYLAAGMNDELITELARTERLRVISRTSCLHYKGTKKPLAQVMRELGVQAAVEGSVARSGDRVRISARLVDAGDRTLWADKYESDMRDVLALQAELATDIAHEIKVKVDPAIGRELQQEILRLRRLGNPELYPRYLEGRFALNQRGPQDAQKALRCFDEILANDSTNALAWSGRADVYSLLGSYGGLPPRSAYETARQAALRALGLDPWIAEAHTSMAFVLESDDWDRAGAEKEFKRAIQVNPSYAEARHWYALFLARGGRLEEARAEIQRALRVDPVSVRIIGAQGTIDFIARRPDLAIARYQEALKLDPGFAVGHYGLGRAYQQTGDHARAVAEIEEAARLAPGLPTAQAALAHAYALAGRRSEARRMVARLERLSKERYVTPVGIALVHLALGDRRRALVWLEQGCEARDHYLVDLKTDPAYDGLRGDSRFQAMLRRVGFAVDEGAGLPS